MGQNKWILKYMLALFLLLTLAWGFRFYSLKQEEKQNVSMVYQILGEWQEGISAEQIAADLLKGNENVQAQKAGMDIMKQYGYDADYKSVFFNRTKGSAVRLAFFYLVLYAVMCGMLFGVKIIFKKKREEEFYRLQELLEHFYNGDYDYLSEEYREGSETLLYNKMESLGQKLKWEEERMQQEKEETKALVTDLSHQLKTPVASIRMCFQLLEEENLQPEEKKEFMERLGDQIVHLDGLLEALVNISRMETGMIAIQKENANIFETVVQAVNQVYMKAEEKGIEITIDGTEPEMEKLILPHDIKWTKEAIVNVLENAIKYSPEGSKIRITMNKLIQFLRIEIKDEGIGIKKEEINRIFQRFYRGKHEVIKQAEGSGVGLYLTRKILEEQGGNITVVLPIDKEKTKGSTFAIMLSLK
ncbi:MAG: HAMP domain-containing histidine kinase [Lachnospiraceae bacterium]|nr:HAMP domain-containing histidine kinase [Lachnospiraceae bacterium]